MDKRVMSLGLFAAAIACGGGPGDGGTSDANSVTDGAYQGRCTLDAMSATNTELVTREASDGIADNIAVDASYVYWQDYSEWLGEPDLLRVPRTGGDPELLAHLDEGGQSVVGADNVYIRTDSEIVTVPKAGGQPVPFAKLESGAWGGGRIAQDDEHVYAMDEDSWCEGQGAIYAFDKQTGEKGVVAKDLVCPAVLALDTDHAYFVEQVGSDESDLALMRVPLAGGTPELLARAPVNLGPGIAPGGSYVYFVESDGLEGFLFRVPKTGGSIEQVLPCGQIITVMRSGEEGVYFANSDVVSGNNGNSFSLIPSDGSSPRFEPAPDNEFAGDFVVDGTTVYQASVEGVWAITHP